MPTTIEDKLQELQRKKDRIQRQERILQERAKRQRVKKLTEIGKLALRAKIHEMDRETLLGAFLEIAELMDDHDKITHWTKKAAGVQRKGANEQTTRIVISFAKGPTSEEKGKLKERGFRWNAFREEFYGQGSEEELQSALSGSSYTLEVIE